MYSVSSIQVFGFQIDSALHFIVGFAMIFILHRFLSIKKTLYVSFGLIALKEIVDVFAKTRAEYIRPPALDAFYDVVFGVIGVLLAVWMIRRREARKAAGPASKRGT
jgi:mannose/fructose/N-acetylgalactosamine-specific phosphotransferase system component IIC